MFYCYQLFDLFRFFVRNSSKLTLSISGGVTKNQESLTQILWRQKWV